MLFATATSLPWEQLQHWLEETKPEPPQTRNRVINEMIICIHRHVFEPDFNVARLRRLCRIADNNISSRFRLLTGRTPREYIEMLRMDTAARALRESPEANVLDIAYLVGYEHPQTFYRAFQRRFGGPPGEVLERHRG